MPILAVDFDGTIADYRGYQGRSVFLAPLPGAIQTLQQFKADGWRIIIFTCRDETDEIAQYLERHQIPFDEINQSLPDGIEYSGKVYADVYLDDRAVTFRGWDIARESVQQRYNELAATHQLDNPVEKPVFPDDLSVSGDKN